MADSKRLITRRGAEVTLMSGTDMLLARATRILHKEIESLEKATHSRYLDEKEARKLQGYIRCIVEMSKERREIDKELSLENMTKEQAIEHLKGLIHRLGGNTDGVSEG